MVRKKLTSVISLVVAATVLLSGTAFAATSRTTQSTPVPNSADGAASDNGLKVSPVRSELSVDAGTSKTVEVTVTNVTPSIASYDIMVNDFLASSDESGQPQILLDADKFAPSHSLKRLVGSVPNVVLQPGEVKVVKVPINVPKDYKAGGYYGAVRFVPHSEDGADGRNLTLSASVGSLVLVTVPGDIKQLVTVASLDARKAVSANQIDSPRSVFTNSKDINATVRFQNAGDVQEQPFGKIALKNWRGKTIATYEVNNTTPRGNVLPDSIRKFNVKLTKLSSFGKYTLSGNFGYGSEGQLITAQSTFYIIPASIVIAFVAVIAFILYLIFGLPRTIKWYNRRVVLKSQKKSRRR